MKVALHMDLRDVGLFGFDSLLLGGSTVDNTLLAWNYVYQGNAESVPVTLGVSYKHFEPLPVGPKRVES